MIYILCYKISMRKHVCCCYWSEVFDQVRTHFDRFVSWCFRRPVAPQVQVYRLLMWLLLYYIKWLLNHWPIVLLLWCVNRHHPIDLWIDCRWLSFVIVHPNCILLL